MAIRTRSGSPYLWIDVKVGNERVRCSSNTTDRAEAAQMERDIRDKLRAGLVVRSKAVTVGDALDRGFREHYKGTKDERTAQLQLEALKQRLGPNAALASVQEPRLRQLVDELVAEGNKRSTINAKLVKLRVIMQKACFEWRDWVLLDRVPTFPRLGKSSGTRHHVYSLEEEAQALAFLYGKHEPLFTAVGELVEVLADTGLRVGEALRLEPGEVDVDHRWLTLWETKNSRPRGVPLTARAAAVLGRRLDTVRCFEDIPGYDAARAAWDQARKAMCQAGNRAFVLHGWRHTAGTRMLAATNDMRLVQQFLGHENISTTQIYAVHADQALSDAVRKLESFTLGPVKGAGGCDPSVTYCAPIRGLGRAGGRVLLGAPTSGRDSKSAGGDPLRVRVSPSAPSSHDSHAPDSGSSLSVNQPQ